MSESGASEGLISRDDIATLAILFDRSELAIDPTSQDSRLAEADFEDQIRLLYSTKVQSAHPSLSLSLFRSKARSLCRTYLRKN